MPGSMRRHRATVAVCFIGVVAGLSVSAAFTLVPATSPPASIVLAAKAVTTTPLRADIPTVWFTITTPTTSFTASVTRPAC